MQQMMLAPSPRLEQPAQHPVLELAGLTKAFGDGAVFAAREVALQLHPGEILSILGPSGCGKTTTMRMIAGLERPSSGDIRVHGESVLGVPPHKRNIGLVFQSLAIFPHMSVRENIAFGLRMRGIPKTEIPGRVERALDVVQLPPAVFADRRPNQLSGGQLQRVALARTIVTEPALVLFDEPMAALDRRLRDHMAVELRAIQKALGIAAIYVTHDQETASMMSDRIAIMDAGRVVQIGAPVDIYRRPANRFVADFLGELNTLSAVAAKADEDAGSQAVEIAGARLATEGTPGTPGAAIQVLIRPEHIAVRRDPPAHSGLPVTVEDVHFISGMFRWRLRLADGQEMVARVPFAPSDTDDPGPLWAEVRPADVLIAKG